jgi:branched-chain amino acid transport system ATP-binding protein
LPDLVARPEPLLEVRDLTAGYGRVPVVSNIQLQVGRGEIVSIIGPNGAGKSTLLKALTGNLPLMNGAYVLGGEVVSRCTADALARRGVAYIPQVDDTFDTLTVEENLVIGGYLLPRGELRRRIDKSLEAFPQLQEMRTRRGMKLSGGERKMLAMARVLLTNPQLVILDEPTAGLSPQMANQVLVEHVPKMSDSAAVLLVEQRALEALGVSMWGYVMVAGRIARSASAGSLRNSDLADLFLGAGPHPATEPMTELNRRSAGATDGTEAN